MLNVLLVLLTTSVAGQPHTDNILLQTDFKGRLKKLTAPTAYEPTAFEADYLRDDNNPLQEYEDGRCCRALTAECLSCEAGVTIEVYCATHSDEQVLGCSDGQPSTEMPNSLSARNLLPNDANDDCCKANTAECLACVAEVTIEEYCSAHADVPGCMEGVHDGGRSINVEDNTVTCATREDPRAVAYGYTTSPPGTSCVFGTDDRDEGLHCIMDDGKFGSFGWCFTSSDHTSWGSCNEHCPLFGQAKVLAKKIDNLHKTIEDQIQKMEETEMETTTVPATSTVLTSSMEMNTPTTIGATSGTQNANAGTNAAGKAATSGTQNANEGTNAAGKAATSGTQNANAGTNAAGKAATSGTQNANAGTNAAGEAASESV